MVYIEGETIDISVCASSDGCLPVMSTLLVVVLQVRADDNLSTIISVTSFCCRDHMEYKSAYYKRRHVKLKCTFQLHPRVSTFIRA